MPRAIKISAFSNICISVLFGEWRGLAAGDGITRVGIAAEDVVDCGTLIMPLLARMVLALCQSVTGSAPI